MKMKRKYKNGGIDPEKKDKTRVVINEKKFPKRFPKPKKREQEKQIQLKKRPMPKKVYRSTLDESPEFPRKSNIETKPNWNKKLSKLTEKRQKKKDKGKDTTRVQKRINKEYYKINPKMKGGGTLMKRYAKKFQEGGLNDETNT